MATSRYTIYPASFVYAGPTTLNLRQLIECGVKAGTDKEIIVPGGAIDPSAVILNFADPRIALRTHDFSAVLGAISISAGLACTGGYTNRLQARVDSATVVLTGGVTLTGSRAFTFIKAITDEQDKPAEMELENVPLWDETYSGGLPVPPVVPTGSVNMSAHTTPTFNSCYWMGPTVIGSTELPGVVRRRVDPGVNFNVKRSSGQVYAPHGAIIQRKPMLSLTVLKADYAATMVHLFNAVMAGGSDHVKFWYLKGVHGGARVALTTAAHMYVDVVTGAWNPEEITVTHPDDAHVTINIQATGTISTAVDQEAA